MKLGFNYILLVSFFLLIALLPLSAQNKYTYTTESFEESVWPTATPNNLSVSSSTGTWITNKGYSISGTTPNGSKYLRFDASGTLQSPGLTSGADTLTFKLYTGSNSKTVVIKTSTDGTNWTTLFTTPTLPLNSWQSFSVPIKNASVKYIQIASPNTVFLDNVLITSLSFVAASDSISGLNYVEGTGPSAMKSFNFSATNLTAGTPITITAPTNFEVSLDGVTWTSTATLPNSAGGTLPATTVYTRLKAGLLMNNYSGDISITGGGKTIPERVTVSGNVTSSTNPSTCISAPVKLFKEDFGTFTNETSRSLCPETDNVTLTYTPTGNITNPGKYAIVSSTFPAAGNGIKVAGYDHTVDAPGKFGGMLLIDCGSASAGKILYSKQFTVCSGGDFEFSAWYADANAQDPSNNYVVPNMTFNIYGVNGASSVLLTTASASPPKLYHTSTIWYQLVKAFNSGTYSTLRIDIVNNENDSHGNDLIIDDIEFKVKVPVQLCMKSPSCFGMNDGEITITSTNGATYNFWLNGSNPQSGANAIYSGLSAGNYTVRILDQNVPCFDYNNISLLPQPDAVSAVATTPPCSSGAGIISVSATGGTPGYQYSSTGPSGPWSSNSTVSGLSAGPHTINVKDANGCTASASSTVNPCCPTGVISGTAQVCNDGTSTTPISVVLTGIGPWAYTYAIDGITQPQVTTSSANNTFPSLPGAHVYTLTDVDDAANTTCTGNFSGTATVTLFSAPTANAGTDISKCASLIAISLSGSVANSTSTAWTTSGTGTFANANFLSTTYTPSAADTAAGTLTLTLTGINPCSSTPDQLTITFDPVPIVNAGPDQAVCVSAPAVTLNGSIANGTGVVWTTAGTGTFSPNNTTSNATYTPSAADMIAGSVTITCTGTGTGNCTAPSDQMVVTITTISANAGEDQTVCGTSTPVSLTGSVLVATGGTWSMSGTGTFGNTNSLSTTYTPSATDISAGSVVLTLTTTGNGTCTGASDQMTINFQALPTANAGGDLNYCVNTSSINISGSVTTATGGSWTSNGNGTFANANALNTTYSPTAADASAGSVTLTLTTTSNAACAAVTDQVVYTFDPIPVANAGADQTSCATTSSVNLTGTLTAATTGTWTTSGSGTFGNANALNTTYMSSVADQSASTVTLTLTTTNGAATCAAASDQMVLTIVAPPDSNLTVTGSNICAGIAGTVTIIGSETGINYEAFIGSTSVSSVTAGNGGNLTLTIPAANLPVGSNIIRVTAYGCQTSNLTNTATIDVTAIPVADAGPDLTFEDYVAITLDGSASSQGGSGYTYLWTTSEPSTSSIASSSSVTTTADVQTLVVAFTLTVTDAVNTNCKASDVTIVKVTPKLVEIPNAFSPNGDNVHDHFDIKNIRFFKNSILYIYNQWGELIYKSDVGYPKQWDGTRNGIPVPVSAYYYVLNLNMEGFKDLSGDITVIK